MFYRGKHYKRHPLIKKIEGFFKPEEEPIEVPKIETFGTVLGRYSEQLKDSLGALGESFSK